MGSTELDRLQRKTPQHEDYSRPKKINIDRRNNRAGAASHSMNRIR
jgi:hypothetical protein